MCASLATEFGSPVNWSRLPPATHLWADRFEGAFDDVFDLQDRIVEQVVGAINPKVLEAEIRRAVQKRPDNLDGYDHLLRAQAVMRIGTTDVSNIAAALVHLEKAIEVQPDYALAYALSADCYSFRYFAGATTDFEVEKKTAVEFARKALALDKDDPEVLCSAGLAIINFDIFEDAMLLFERAINLNPNLSRGWHYFGAGLWFLGDPTKGFECLQRALRLAPVGPQRSALIANASLALLLMDRHEESYAWAERAYQENSDHPLAIRALAASAAMTGNLARAKMAFQRIASAYPQIRERDRRLMRRPVVEKLHAAHAPRGCARMTPTRRLAAIMAADVAGFSAAMECTSVAAVHESENGTKRRKSTPGRMSAIGCKADEICSA